MIDKLLTLATDSVAAAMTAGADAAEAMIADGFGRHVEIRDGNIENLEQAEGSEIGLRVFVGKSSAMISGSVLTKEAIARLIDTALNVARLAPPDPFAGIAETEYLATTFPDLDMISATLPDAADLQRMAREAEEAGLSVPGVSKSGGAGASASDRRIVLATSNGFAHGYRRTGTGVSMSAIAGEGTAMERDYDYSSSTHFSDLRNAQDVGREAGRCLWCSTSGWRPA